MNPFAGLLRQGVPTNQRQRQQQANRYLGPRDITPGGGRNPSAPPGTPGSTAGSTRQGTAPNSTSGARWSNWDDLPDDIPRVRKRERFSHGTSAFYDDSWGSIYRGLESGDDGTESAMRLLRDFQGKPEHMEELIGSNMFKYNAPQFLRNSDAYNYLQDFENLDRSMDAYGAGAGQIAANAQNQLRAGQQQLAAAGLGRSTAMAGMANQMALGAANQQANLFANMWQQHVNNTSRYAAMAFDMDRQVTQMALGQDLMARDANIDEGMSESAGYWGLGGAVLGGVVGSLVPGLGTAAGIALGGGIGAGLGS